MAHTEVPVFALRAQEEVRDWPERSEREQRWLDPVAASHMVENEGLNRLLQIFSLI